MVCPEIIWPLTPFDSEVQASKAEYLSRDEELQLRIVGLLKRVGSC